MCLSLKALYLHVTLCIILINRCIVCTSFLKLALHKYKMISSYTDFGMDVLKVTLP